MKTFSEYARLDEKLILFNQGKRYGQIVILAGGSGSGKGYVISNFIEGDKFKILDVDSWKEAFLSLSKLRGQYPEIRGLSLSNPEDVYKLHVFIREKGIKTKIFQNLFGAEERNKEILPNILFDITGKSMGDLVDIATMAAKAGYQEDSIHVLYVLTDWRTAYRRNLGRERIVPSTIFLETHRGATQTLQKILDGQLPNIVDGSINIVLNNKENTKFHIATKVVKDFSYINVKKEGSPLKSDAELLSTIERWLHDNAPESSINPEHKTK